jgi:transcriptional regulator with XRE-family HTH domain
MFKDLVSKHGLTQEAFSDRIGVSRQTFADWTNGQVPKGSHLLAICRILDVEPETLFEVDAPLLVPAHRTRRAAKRTPERDRLATVLAGEYRPLFDGIPSPLRMTCEADGVQAPDVLAGELRHLAGADDPARPLDYEHVFTLLDKLGICVVFRTFSDGLKDYAFYVRVASHRVIFVNTQTNVLDLVFPLLHEVVHAIRDVGPQAPHEYTPEEETFCDSVACSVQFPVKYVIQVRTMLKGKPAATQVNTLKTLARDNHHAVYGLYKAMEREGGVAGLRDQGIHGADANLRKSFPNIATYLAGQTPDDLLCKLESVSLYFVRVLKAKAGSITLRMFSQLLELDSVLDARQVRDLLLERETHACAM